MPGAGGKRKADDGWGAGGPAAKKDSALQASSAANANAGGGRGWGGEVQSPPGRGASQDGGDAPLCKCGVPAQGATSKVRGGWNTHARKPCAASLPQPLQLRPSSPPAPPPPAPPRPLSRPCPCAPRAQTAANPGRAFFACSKPRDAADRCGYFK
jgi:hypothetical protein